MSTPFLSQIEIFSFNFAPKGWAQCNGQLLPINQNQALFSLLGTTYGGDGRVNFGLPDLRSRVPVGGMNVISLGERGGEESHTINQSEMPLHNHAIAASTSPANLNVASTTSFLAQSNGVASSGGTFSVAMYGTGGPGGVLDSHSMSTNGGNQAHTNLMPFLVLNMCIALQGIF